MRRILIYNHLDAPLGELSANDVFSCTRREEINGEHSLEIVTTQVLEQGQRIVYQDGRGLWREYVVYGVDEDHSSGRTVVGTYYCVWSVQPDLQGVCVSKMPGVQSPVTAGYALSEALSEQTRWSVGTVTNSNTGGASMYDMSAWKAMGVLVGNWGGELGVTIQVSTVGGYVTSRAVDLYSQMGSQTARRRFDFGADLKSVKRKVADGPLYCRMSPRGKGAQTEGGGYGRKIRINDNDPTAPDYITYAPMVDVAKLPDGAGGYQYPTKIVENSDCETPEDLLAWAESAIAGELAPKVTYEIDALQAAREGVDMQGVSLGDSVDLVDRKFRADGVRLTGRVVGIVVDEITGKNDSVTIGTDQESIASKFSDSGKVALEAVNALAGSLTTAAYIENLVERINADINATGGYTYIIPGNGIRTYDAAVSDPLVGSEAGKVVEIKGGTVRIANSRTSGGDWDWKTVFSSGFIGTDVLTANNVVVGKIEDARNKQSPGSGNYWDLDNGILSVKNGSVLADLITAGRISSANGKVYFDLDNNELVCDKLASTATTGGVSKLVANMDAFTIDSYNTSGMSVKNSTYDDGAICIKPGTSSSDNAMYSPMLYSKNSMRVQNSSGSNIVVKSNGSVELNVYDSSVSGYSPYISVSKNSANTPDLTLSSRKGVRVSGGGSFTITGGGTKSRLAETENYGDRLLYCYETPTPMFGDVGSGEVGDDGTCVVEIDDVFSETVNTRMGYQTFIQKRGDGDVWVESKAPTHFVVRGTPGLPFDWEVKAKQLGFEYLRIDEDGLDPTPDELPSPESAHADHVAELEQLLLQETVLIGE